MSFKVLSNDDEGVTMRLTGPLAANATVEEREMYAKLKEVEEENLRLRIRFAHRTADWLKSGENEDRARENLSHKILELKDKVAELSAQLDNERANGPSHAEHAERVNASLRKRIENQRQRIVELVERYGAEMNAQISRYDAMKKTLTERIEVVEAELKTALAGPGRPYPSLGAALAESREPLPTVVSADVVHKTFGQKVERIGLPSLLVTKEQGKPTSVEVIAGPVVEPTWETKAQEERRLRISAEHKPCGKPECGICNCVHGTDHEFCVTCNTKKEG